MLLKYHFSLLGNFGVFFLAILKTNMFSHHLSKRNVILNFDFKRFSVYISGMARQNSFKIS